MLPVRTANHTQAKEVYDAFESGRYDRVLDGI
jgi:hypothetical protein